jgi:hypothetical protein
VFFLDFDDFPGGWVQFFGERFPDGVACDARAESGVIFIKVLPLIY